MAEEAKNPQASSLAKELDTALTTLDSALTEASRSVAIIRSSIPQIAALAEVVREMEVAMTRARQNLSMPSSAAPQPDVSTSLRIVPQEAASEPTQPEPSRPVSRCLRLDVSSRGGSLDLKVVDGSVNENPAVVDVALLDYDGRQATLKLWIDASADADEVREALLSSLRRRLGDEGDAEVRIDFEEESAA